MTAATLSMISPIWASLMISGGVSASVSPATRSLKTWSLKALAGALDQTLVPIDVEGGQTSGAGERMRGVGIAVEQFDDVLRALHEGVVDVVADQHAAHRHRAVGDALGEGDHVRHLALSLGSDRVAEAAEAGDDLVEDQ